MQSDDDHLWSKHVNQINFTLHSRDVLVICFMTKVLLAIEYLSVSTRENLLHRKLQGVGLQFLLCLNDISDENDTKKQE
jgi:hypothetical protein